ncbi:MAG: PD40 domain-containing protein [Armatimonadota bacterium]|nr:MAG: PD40 domain-containing protein [Armatimonadota bacterium]
MRGLTPFPTRVGSRIRRIPLCLLFSLILCAVLGTLAWAAPPVIEDVQIDRGRDTDAPDWACYHQRVVVMASDADGAADIASVTITDPAPGGEPHTVTPDEGGYWWQEDANTIGCEWSQWRLLSAPDAGAYTVTVADTSANEDTLTTPSAPAVSETHPELLAPAMESVISDPRPTFEWTVGLTGSSYHITLEEEGTWGAIWSTDVPGTQCDYNFDGSASQPDLLGNRSYFCDIVSTRPEDDRVTDPRVAIYTEQHTRGRFTVYGAWPATPPELPGKLVYSICFSAENIPEWYPNWGMSSTMAYNTDAHSRDWVAADHAHFPDWSPDGTKLLYSKWPGIWIDSLDGTPPAQVPDISGIDCSWASDSKRVVYAVEGPPSPYTPANNDIWVSSTDGSIRYPLVESIESQDRYPDWGPDGLWIAYRKLPDAEGVGLHLVRYDGTQDHALIATGVAGYPGYAVGYMGEHSWSPDGKKLVVLFQASSTVDDISGIGVISRDGGEITPAFVAPPGVICCAQPHLPKWSPDGTQIIFVSGHHLSGPDLPVKFQWIPTPELWLVNADGSGAPVRLTYDNGMNFCPTWWAPNTEPGADVSITKGDTTVTFDQVTDTGDTSITVYEEPIGLPVNYEFAEDYYQVTTTAEIAGPISICMTYRDEDIPTGVAEEDLAILHYVEEGDYWEDITISRDPESNIVCGESDSLSVFVLSAAPPGHFPDVPSTGLGPGRTESHWAFDQIEACVNAGIVQGFPGGDYAPELKVGRDAMAVFIGRAKGWVTIGDDMDTAPELFPDVPAGHWAGTAIQACLDNEVVAGYPHADPNNPSQTFYLYEPMQPVTRDQMAVFIARAKEWVNINDDMATAPEVFPDVPAGFWAGTAVQACVNNGVVQGYSYANPDNPGETYYLYEPAWVVSRDQMAVFIARAFELLM